VQNVLGVLEEVWRYPVKSLLGERLERPARVSQQGLDGDRVLALIDRESGAVASAKRPARWRDTLQLRAQTVGDQVVIELPDGSRVYATGVQADTLISRALGREIHVSSAPQQQLIERAVPEAVLDRGPAADVEHTSGPAGRDTRGETFHDFAAIHILTTASIARLSALIAGDPLEAVRYRPNLIVRTPEDVAAEIDWPGCHLRIGGAEFHVTIPTPRCAVPMQSHGTLPERPDAFRVLKEHGRVPVADLGELPCIGVYARVVRSGTVAAGDDVHVED